MAQLNSIGLFTFLTMSEPVPLPKLDFVFQSRAGVNGHAIWSTGERGTNFTVHTAVDLANYAVARQRLLDYQQAQRDGFPMAVTWANLNESPRSVLILDVKPINGTPKAIAGGVGGTYYGMSQGFLEASWTLHNLY